MFLLSKKPISISYFVCNLKHNKAADISSVKIACCVINCKLKETVKHKPKAEGQFVKWKDTISYSMETFLLWTVFVSVINTFLNGSMKEAWWCMNWRPYGKQKEAETVAECCTRPNVERVAHHWDLVGHQYHPTSSFFKGKRGQTNVILGKPQFFFF